MKTPPEQIEGNGELVLLVDDEQSVRSITKMILEKHNYRVLEASDGPDALAVFAQHKDSINVVLSDMMMPYMDGAAVIRAIQQMRSDVVCIASTGQADDPRVSELHSLNVTNFLTKPYDTNKLLKALHDAVGRKPSALS
jgi:two-component system cell cycle sensor histidine kinase/response regulator CckA